MELQEVVAVLKEIASPSLAGSWDNVGLLVEPSPPHQVRKILLTNDLTASQSWEEAVDEKVNMIVSYHPPIFAPLKRNHTELVEGEDCGKVSGEPDRNVFPAHKLGCCS
nr:hypothetical protein BaRGS_015370 [Batillaria attramentaria]